MATTFVGIEMGGHRARPRHTAVVLRRQHAGVELRHWCGFMSTDQELLEYLAAMAAQSGVIAIHGQNDECTAVLIQRIWRVLDYRLRFALAPRHRTRAVVRVDPVEIQRAFTAPGQAPSPAVLHRMRGLTPAVDLSPLTQGISRLPVNGTLHHRFQGTIRAGLSAYAALWCWWHGPAGYDVLGASHDSYRLAPRILGSEADVDRSKFGTDAV